MNKFLAAFLDFTTRPKNYKGPYRDMSPLVEFWHNNSWRYYGHGNNRKIVLPFRKIGITITKFKRDYYCISFTVAFTAGFIEIDFFGLYILIGRWKYG